MPCHGAALEFLAVVLILWRKLSTTISFEAIVPVLSFLGAANLWRA